MSSCGWSARSARSPTSRGAMARNSCKLRPGCPSKPTSHHNRRRRRLEPWPTSPMAASRAQPSLPSPHDDGLACHPTERSTPSPFPYMSNRGTVVAAAIVGALLVGAAGIGIVYFVFFPGSSPQKLALSSPTPSTSATSASTATPASTPAAGTWTVTSGSQAGYRVREQLASLPAPSDAVGRTSAVTGTLVLAQSASGYSVTAASVTVDVSKLSSDQSRRDQRIHSQGLESDRYPTATFKLTSPIALSADATSGQTIHVSATGDLNIPGVTKR